jgi:hypothetical protein
MTRLLKASLALVLVGVVTTVPVLLQETPWTFVLFAFVAQPLIGLGFLGWLASAVAELRKTGLLA